MQSEKEYSSDKSGREQANRINNQLNLITISIDYESLGVDQVEKDITSVPKNRSQTMKFESLESERYFGSGYVFWDFPIVEVKPTVMRANPI